MTTRRSTDNTKAIDAFIKANSQINEMLERLKSLSDDHFGACPGEINWGYVGTLDYYADILRRLTDEAFKEGEHAA